MLTIPQTLPIKQMAIYGSAALLIGFTGTLTMLRQFAPKDSATSVAVVETINKKPSANAANGVESNHSDASSTNLAPTLPDQGKLIGSGNSTTRSHSSTVSTPNAYSAPTTATVETPTAQQPESTVVDNASVDQPAQSDILQLEASDLIQSDMGSVDEVIVHTLDSSTILP